MTELASQMGNLGAEVTRLLNWQKEQRTDQAERALTRALELLDPLISLSVGRRRNEFLRLREVLCAQVYAPREFTISADLLFDYFLPFAILARKGKWQTAP